jgi:predicted phage terminase large subunit-like protein
VEGTRNFFANGVLTHNCDDPHPTQKAESEAERNNVLRWWNEAIPTRLNEPDRGVKIVIQQRVHTRDLAGDCIAKGYHKVVLPMEFEPDHPDRHPRDIRTKPGELLHPERINHDALLRLKRALGEYAVAGQLQQRPVPRGGGVFNIAKITIIDALPADALQLGRVRRWDLAATVPKHGNDPDWTVGVRMCKDEYGRFYIDDVKRFQEDPAGVEQAIKAVASADGMNTRLILPQDPGQAGKSQARYLASRFAPYPVETVRETGDKMERARSFIAQVSVGNVYLVRGPWNQAFLEELEQFPYGAHDDQVDAAVGAFLALMGGTDGILEWMRQQIEELG